MVSNSWIMVKKMKQLNFAFTEVEKLICAQDFSANSIEFFYVLKNEEIEGLPSFLIFQSR